MQRQLSRCDISGVYVPVDDVILVCAKNGEYPITHKLI